MTAAAAVSSASLGECLALATAKSLSFTKVNSLKKLHVQTLDLGGRSAGKLVSVPEHRILGVGATTRKMDPQTGDVMQSGHFELRDEISMKRASSVICGATIDVLRSPGGASLGRTGGSDLSQRRLPPWATLSRGRHGDLPLGRGL